MNEPKAFQEVRGGTYHRDKDGVYHEADPYTYKCYDGYDPVTGLMSVEAKEVPAGKKATPSPKE